MTHTPMTSKRAFVVAAASAVALAGCAAVARRPKEPTIDRLTLADGRTLEVFLGGDAGGFPLVTHHGTPGDCTTFADWSATCAKHGFRLVCASRAGYGNSSRLRGRAVAHAAQDTAAVLDQLGHSRFATLGWSGGGPHALACAALLPARCVALATMGGVGGYGAPDLDFLAGMGPENLSEFGAAVKGEPALRRWIDENASSLRTITGSELAAELGGLVPEVDKRALTGTFADTMAASLRRAIATSFDGWIDDDLAFTRPWGFDVTAIRQPAAVWQGEQDLMVPLAHGRWLLSKMPTAVSRITPNQGHLSLATESGREQIVALLRQQAGV